MPKYNIIYRIEAESIDAARKLAYENVYLAELDALSVTVVREPYHLANESFTDNRVEINPDIYEKAMGEAD